MPETDSGRWYYTSGEQPHQVTVEEFPKPGGNLYLRWYDREMGNTVRESLGHKDRSKGMTAADEKARAFRENAEMVRRGEVTPRLLIDRYLRDVTPGKTERGQKVDRRTAEMVKARALADEVATEIDTKAWRDLIEDRRSGAIDCRGNYVPPKDRTPVGDRTVEADLRWMRTVFNWATREKVNGEHLLLENPLDGVEIPKEKNPTREIIPKHHYRAMLGVAEDVHPRLPFMLTLAWETGRRIKEIRRLQYRDFRLERGANGAIHWRGENHKMDLDDVVPVSETARKAIREFLQEFPGFGQAWVFPHPERGDEPCGRWFPEKWFGEAEDAADLEPISKVKWHGMRRGFATRLLDQGVSPKTVARLGGWASVKTVLEIYAQPGDEAMEDALKAVSGR